jgi:hypothetical protein
MTAHRAVLLLFGFLHLAVACAAPAAERPGYREPAAAPLPGIVTQPPSPSLTYVYEKPPSAAFHGLFDTLRDSRILEAWVGYVNAVLRPLPQSIVAAFAECGEANSRYEPDPHRIVLCYEEAERSFGLLKRAGYAGETQLLTAWIGSLLHQLYHELGHALSTSSRSPCWEGRKMAQTSSRPSRCSAIRKAGTWCSAPPIISTSCRR